MNSLKNWDNNTWLSSKKYINTFNNFLRSKVKLNKNSKILDIGCGRGKIIGDLYTNLNLRNKPIGIDVENHKDRNKLNRRNVIVATADKFVELCKWRACARHNQQTICNAFLQQTTKAIQMHKHLVLMLRF